MGEVIAFIMRVFSVVLLVTAGVNFSVAPASFLARLTPEVLGTMFWLVAIMVYYMVSTFLPIDKITGELYPVFGVSLIIMGLGIAGTTMIFYGSDMPELTAAALMAVHPNNLPQVVHDACHGGLRRHFRLPRCPALYYQREGRPDRFPRRNGGGGNYCPDLGRCRRPL